MVKQDCKQLGVEQVDLVLLHHPAPTDRDNQALWKGLEQALAQKLTRSIGISNFNQAQIEGMKATVTPAVNQAKMSINTHDDATITYCQKQNITYESFQAMKYCPFKHPAVAKIATSHKVSTAQVCLRWVLDRGCVSATGTGAAASKVADYTKENLAIYDFTLTDAEVKVLDAIQGEPPNPTLNAPGARVLVACGVLFCVLFALAVMFAQRPPHQEPADAKASLLGSIHGSWSPHLWGVDRTLRQGGKKGSDMASPASREFLRQGGKKSQVTRVTGDKALPPSRPRQSSA
jgi:hypothetical protein